MRFKNRYVLFELLMVGRQREELAPEELVEALRAEAAAASGALGAARIFSAFKLIYCDFAANYFVARVPKPALAAFLATLFYARAVGARKARFRLLKASGTVKRLEEALLLRFKAGQHRGLRRLAGLRRPTLPAG